MNHALRRLTALALATSVSVVVSSGQGLGPARGHTDREFWDLVTTLSEAPGYHPSDNLISTEPQFPSVVAALSERGGTGGVFVGVGPEQNFHYIAVLKPVMAFVVDTRLDNRTLHLLYKAVFERSKDRGEFLALLLARDRPSISARDLTVHELVAAFRKAKPVPRSGLERNIRTILDTLVRWRGGHLSDHEQAALRFIYESFYRHGLDLRYSARRDASVSSGLTYGEMLSQVDNAGVPRSFLATEQSFGIVKDLQGRNLVLPIVGDFAGSQALRSVGKYLRAQSLVVSVFYLSDVEPILVREGRWSAFCHNVASLPVTEASLFIRHAPTGPIPGPDGTLRWPVRTMVGQAFAIDPIQADIQSCPPSLAPPRERRRGWPKGS